MFKQSIIYFLYIEMGFCFVNPCFKTKVSLRRPRWKYAGQMYSNNANMDESKISREELIEARVNKQYWSLSDLYDNIGSDCEYGTRVDCYSMSTLLCWEPFPASGAPSQHRRAVWQGGN